MTAVQARRGRLDWPQLDPHLRSRARLNQAEVGARAARGRRGNATCRSRYDDACGETRHSARNRRAAPIAIARNFVPPMNIPWRALSMRAGHFDGVLVDGPANAGL
jgi:hypothetical protein